MGSGARATWRRSIGAALALVAITACVVGCDRKKNDQQPVPNPTDDDDKVLADDGADANLAENDPEVLTSSLIASSPSGELGLASVDVGGNLGPRTFGDVATAAFLPRGCLVVTPDPDATKQEATYTFTRCITGPNGLKALNGEVKVRYARAGEGNLHLDLTGSNLHVNRAIADWHATADIVTEGSKRTMTWSAQLSGTTAGERAFSRTTRQQVVWTLGEECFELDGVSEGKIRDRDIKTEVSNFKRCRASCPAAGGKITVTNVPKAKTITLLYDGSGTATFVDSRSRSVPVVLPCSFL